MYKVKIIKNEIKKDKFKYLLNGVLHREGGPAVEENCGNKIWYLNGKKHRLDGPAIEMKNGNTYWYINDKLHREDGPAIESNGNKRWFLNDVDYGTEDRLLARVKSLKEAKDK